MFRFLRLQLQLYQRIIFGCNIVLQFALFNFSMSSLISMVTLSQFVLPFLLPPLDNNQSLSHSSQSIFCLTVTFDFNCFVSRVVIFTVSATTINVRIFLYGFNIYCIYYHNFILNYYYLVESFPSLWDVFFNMWLIYF